MAEGYSDRFLGGSPLGVLVRLVLLSILVGVVLTALGVDFWNLLPTIERLVRRVLDMGWEAFAWLWRYFVLGAIVVIPIWLLVRLTRTARGRP
jgi:Family of unknown function (DUF6460)